MDGNTYSIVMLVVMLAIFYFRRGCGYAAEGSGHYR